MTDSSQDPGITESYVTIGFAPDACDTADRKIRELQDLVVEIVPTQGDPFDCIIVDTAEWSGEDGHPVNVRKVDEDFDPVGPVLTVDAKHIIVY